ncbi:ABC transporter ATP-binding protein [Rhodopila sp.]|uniref:ABC transporter ATP-binding protein n=1 Tax=Rhodopila sp. TaxID=2480087 RepID=UPI003D1052E3
MGGAATQSREAFVAFDALTVRYAPRRGEPVLALDRVSLSFEAGEFVCIVGPSGCGKTTMLQVLGGFLPPSDGAVRLEGTIVTKPGPERGIVFQQPALFPWMSVAANAAFGPRVRGQSRAARAAVAERWLRTVGLWEFRDRYPYELSGGMQQRLAIARALANEPKILLMDEPFGALDALTRERLQQELHAVWRQADMTVVFITHGVEEAVYLGTKVVVMSPRPGRIVRVIDTPFARRADEHGIRAVKSSAEFVAVREQVLGLIWEMEV